MSPALATYVCAALIVVASLYVGRAFFAVLGKRETEWFETSVGLALLIVVCSVATRAPGRATTSAIACGVLLLASVIYLRFSFADRSSFLMAAPVIGLILLVASIPFILAGQIGIPGMGVQNDLASHLLWSDYLHDPTGPVPVGIQIGYPVGPHGMAATLAEGLGTQPLFGFLGLLLATMVITGLTSLNLFGELSPLRRTLGAVLVAVPYLAASTLGVAGFKELLVGVFLLSFALILRALPRKEEGRTALIFALAVLAAGTVATFSLPGLGWLGATLGIWAVIGLLVAARDGKLDEVRAGIRGVRVALLTLGALFAVLVISEIPRIIDFFDTGAVDTINSVDSKLRFAVSPLELLGAWPSGEFTLGTSQLDGWQIYGAVGLVAFGFAALWWWRQRDFALPSAVIATLIVYLGTLAVSGLYVQSKAVLVPTAVVMAFILAALLAREGGTLRWVIAIPFIALAGYSSFLALRDTVIAPRDRLEELESLRPEIEGKAVVALNSDRYSDYYLRGSELRSPAKNAEQQVANRPDKNFRLPVDFDSTFPTFLDGFDYAVTTDAEYQSQPPPNFEEVDRTDSYVLWKRVGPTPEFGVLAEEARPGRIFRCENAKFAQELATQGFTTIWPQPVIAKRLYWKIDGELDPTPAPGTENEKGDGTTTLEPGQSASQTITLPPGRWDLSFQYVSPISTIQVQAPGLDAEMPPGMEAAIPFKVDEGPYWVVGSVEGTGKPIEITVTANDDRSGLQKLFGVDAPASIGNITATQLANTSSAPIAASCKQYVDHYFVGPPGAPVLLQDTAGSTITNNAASVAAGKK
jgi:hypothetical protein